LVVSYTCRAAGAASRTWTRELNEIFAGTVHLGKRKRKDGVSVGVAAVAGSPPPSPRAPGRDNAAGRAAAAEAAASAHFAALHAKARAPEYALGVDSLVSPVSDARAAAAAGMRDMVTSRRPRWPPCAVSS